MDDKTKDILIYNLLCDYKKKVVDKFELAYIVRTYMTDHKLSERGLGKVFAIPKSTINDILLWESITQKEYDGYIDEGYTHTDIYRSLRTGNLKKNKEGRKEIDIVLTKCIYQIEFFKIRPPYSNETKELINKLRHVLEVIDQQIK